MQQQVLALYESENVPKKGITKEELSKLEKKLSKVGSSAEVQPYLNQVYALYDYVAMEEFLNKNFPEECLKYPVVDTDLEELQKLYQSLLTEYQPIFQERYELFINQYQDIQDAKSALRKLFQDDNLNYVRDGVTLAEKNKVYQLFVNLPQKQMLEQYEVAFTRVDTYIEKQKEEDKKQEEERRKEQELIQKSYVKIKGIPFISQKDSEVFNGCEAASLLMALQYYGFAKEYDLVSFAQIFPKHDSDPHQGFIYDIFKREPYDVVHWIAPDALTRYAKTYMNASDISGKEVSSIPSYIDQGKPVIAYITDEFKPVKKWVGEVPLNMHVVLVVGYNTYNGSYVVYDPYWGELVVEKSKFETSYQILKYGVVVG